MYTHYWYTRQDADPALLVEAGREMYKLVEASKIPLASWDGTRVPEYDAVTGRLHFNGRSPHDYESFTWPPQLDEPQPWVSDGDEGWHFQFCKTAHQPYDAVVCACLVVAQRVLGHRVRILSDGSPQEFLRSGETETAEELYQRVFDEKAEIHLERETV